jgi:hypothetical protein
VGDHHPERRRTAALVLAQGLVLINKCLFSNERNGLQYDRTGKHPVSLMNERKLFAA